MDVKNIELLHEKPYIVSWKADGIRWEFIPCPFLLKTGSQYDIGVASVTSVVSIMGKEYFFSLVKLFLIDVNFISILIGWMLANTGNAMLE